MTETIREMIEQAWEDRTLLSLPETRKAIETVIEMLDNGKWKPTIGVGLTKIHGQWQRREWRRRNPDDKFRLRKYATNRSK